MLIEERRTTHREIWNADNTATRRCCQGTRAGAIKFQNRSCKKISFQTRGPFQIIEKLEGNSYLVQKYGVKD